MTRYSKNQFFNITKTGESGAVQNGVFVPSGKTQAPFTYPGNTVRYSGADPSNPQYSHKLQRGYMRSLLPSTATSSTSSESLGVTDGIPSAVCQFQFNPQTIRQNVQQNPNVTHFIMQPPSQFAQPMMGNVNFQFDLLFDRSAELNTRPTERVNTESPWEKNGPEEIGVLHDLSRLFAVIGQGLSSDQLTYAKKVLEDQYKFNREDPVAGLGDEPDTTSTPASLDSESLDSFISLNLGNAGFLLPLPVRVVFSSLYIVEGLVQSCEVQFTRFTTSMVPMQCFVSLVMEAKYIGFAKKDTFFTHAMEDVLRDRNETAARIEAAATEIGWYLTREIPNVTVWIGNDNGSSKPLSEFLSTFADVDTERRMMMTIDNLIVERAALNDPSNAKSLANRMEDGEDLTISIDSGTYEFLYYGDSAISEFAKTGKTRDSNPSEFVKWLRDNASDPKSPNVASTKGNYVITGGFGEIDGTSSASTQSELQDLRDQIKGQGQKLSSNYGPVSPSSQYYCIVFEFQITVKYQGEEFVGRQGSDNYLLFKNKGLSSYETVAGSPSYVQGPDEGTNFAPVLRVSWPSAITQSALNTPVI